MKNKKILITVGGTGGHVYPAMALAQQLLENNPSYQIFFVGGGLKTNPYFNKNDFPFQEIPCGSFSLFKPMASLKGVGRILQGIRHSRRLIHDFNPDLVVGFGSYYTLPTLIAAKTASVPILLHEANRIPGKVNRCLSPYAVATAVHFPDTGQKLKGRSLTASIPLRAGYRKDQVSKKEALNYFKLDPKLKTLLIFGGSQGAQAINKLASQTIIELPEILKKQVQVLHFTGDNRSQQIEELYKQNQIPTVVREFETRMDLAWQASDLVISRSGAGTLAEQLEFEVPGVLIPYPHATDNHQESNADYLVDVGGAVKLLEKGLDKNKLLTTLVDLLSDDGYALKNLSEAMKQHKIAIPSKELHQLVSEILAQRS